VECFIEDLKKNYLLKVKEKPNQHLEYTFDWQANGSLLVHQSDFAQKILDKFDITTNIFNSTQKENVNLGWEKHINNFTGNGQK
jgi:hypothetical protein